MAKLDKIDVEIIRMLRRGGRESNREVARQLSISEGTVRSRLRRLKAGGQFRLIVQRDPAAFGYSCLAYVRLQVDAPHVDRVASELFAKRELIAVTVTLSRFNVFAVVVGKDRSAIDRLVLRLRKRTGVQDAVVYEAQETLQFSLYWSN